MPLHHATPEQIEAYDQSLARSREYQERMAARDIVTNVLRLADKVTDDGVGYFESLGHRRSAFFLTGQSIHISLEDEQVPNRGARMTADRMLITKERLRKGNPKTIGRLITAATVEIGVITDDLVGTSLVGAETVLSVAKNEDIVRYRSGDAPLAEIHPHTEDWLEMTLLVDNLLSHEADLHHS